MRALAIVWEASAEPSSGSGSAVKSKASSKADAKTADHERAAPNRMQCARIAEACFHLGTTAALYPGPSVAGVCLDVTGCASLFGKSLEEGERAIVEEAMHRATSLLANEELAHDRLVRVALADGPRVALGVAAFGGGSRVIVPKGHARVAMARLPLSALPLPDVARSWLARLGISKVSELLALPRKELGSRLGAAEKDVFSLAEGDDRAPLIAYVPEVTPEETVDLDLGIDSHEALAFVLKTLSTRMSGRLSGRGVAVAKMEVVLSLDVASLTGKKGERAREEGRRRERHVETVVLPAPLSGEKDLFVVLRAKMERVTLSAPVRGVTLRITELTDKPARALSLFAAQPKAEGILARLAGELSVEGCAVGELALRDTWDPALRTELVPFGTNAKRRKSNPIPASPFASIASIDGFESAETAPEPTCVLEKKIAIDRKDMKPVRFLSRIEQIHWWQDARVSTDRVMGRVGDKLACVEIHRATGDVEITGYFD